MGFFKVDTSEENIKDYSGESNYISRSDIYEIIIKSAIVDVSDKGSQCINLWVEHNGQEQPIFQAMRITNNDGSANFGQGLFAKLCIILGASHGDDIPDPVSRQVPIGKQGALKDCKVLEVFDDLPVYVRIQLEYSMYEGKIQEKKIVRNFFRFEDKATASEITTETEPGKQYEKELEYVGKDTYKDGLTEEDVIEWKKNRKKDNSPKETNKKPSSGFGGKKFGNR